MSEAHRARYPVVSQLNTHTLPMSVFTAQQVVRSSHTLCQFAFMDKHTPVKQSEYVSPSKLQADP